MEIAQYIDQIDQQQKEMDAVYHNAAVRYGLSDSAMWVLYMVSDEGGCTQQDLCRQSFFAKQTVNSTIAKLVKNGLVRLEAIPGGRNRKQIWLTEAGRTLTAGSVDHIRAAEQRAYGQFSREELAAYLDMTTRLTAYLRAEMEKL